MPSPFGGLYIRAPLYLYLSFRCLGNFTTVAVTGDFADFQFISDRLDEKVRQSRLLNDNIDIGPREIYSWLNRVLYYRRTQLNPLWLNLVVAGWDNSVSSDGIPFLSYIDMVISNCIRCSLVYLIYINWRVFLMCMQLVVIV